MNREHIDYLRRQITADNLTNRQLWDMAGDAVSEENLDLITALWELGINFTDNPYHYNAPMWYACHGHLDVVKHLVNLGVDPAGCSTELSPYTIVASHDNQWETVWFLLEHGAAVNALDPCLGDSLLESAVSTQDINIVNMLLALGADPMRVGERHYPFWSDWLNLSRLDEKQFCVFEMCLYLLMRVQYDTQDRIPFGDIHRALLDRVTPDQKDQYGKTAMHLLIKEGCLEGVAYLLEKGWPIDIRSDNGDSVLHTAYLFHPEMLPYLLDKGADPYMQNKHGSTLLQISRLYSFRNCEVRDSQVLERIESASTKQYPYPFELPDDTPIEELAKWKELQASDGTTLLHHAIMRKRYEFALRLLDAGYDPQLPINIGYSPLALACRNRAPMSFITRLLEMGAQPVLPVYHIYWSVPYLDYTDEYLTLVQSFGADINELNEWNETELNSVGCIEAAQLLYDHGIDLTRHGIGREQPVFDHAKYGRWSIVRFIVSHGVDPLNLDSEGKSLLHYAYDIDTETAQFLLDRGGDINRRDHRGMTPFIWAAVTDNREYAYWLMEHSANPDITDNTGRSASDWAWYLNYDDDLYGTIGWKQG